MKTASSRTKPARFQSKLLPTQSGRGLPQSAAALRKANRAFRVLSEFNQMLVRETDEARLRDALCRHLVELGGYRLAWVGFAEPDEARSVRPVAQAGFEAGYPDGLRITWADTERGRGPTGAAIRTGQTVVAQDILHDPQMTPWHEQARQHGCAASVALPLIEDGRTFGALMVCASEPNAFDEEELNLLTELAGDLAFGITALRLRAEHERQKQALRESEELFRNITVAAGEGILGLDLQGNHTFVNPAAARMLGYEPGELIGRRSHAMWHHTRPDGSPYPLEECPIYAAFKDGVVHHAGEEMFWRKDGTSFLVEFVSTPILEHGKAVGAVVTFRDITERKKTEAELARHRDHLEELVGERAKELQVARAAALNLLQDAQRAEAEIKRINASLEQRVQERTAELSEANAQLRRSKEVLHMSLQAARAGSWDWDGRTNRTLWSPECYALYGLAPSDKPVRRDDWLARIHPEDRDRLSQETPRVLAERRTDFALEFRIVHPEKGVRWLADIGRATYDADGKPLRLTGLNLDITERKRAEETLRESEDRYRSLVEESPDAIGIYEDGKLVFVNSTGARLLGAKTKEELLGRKIVELIHPDDVPASVDRVRRELAGETGMYPAEVRYRRLDGTTLPVEVIATPITFGGKAAVQFIARDITERKLIERQLQRMDRLESIGTLAGGVAHDLNNALAPILMATQLLRLEFPDTASSYLDLIQGGARRGADMVKQLLTFAKGAEGERLLVEPTYLLKEMEKLITSTFPKNIELQIRYPKNLRAILGDATQLHQVLLNLCVNARDAMPKGGTLTLEAESQKLDASLRGGVPEAKPGRYVVWRVTDTGTGMTPEVLDHVFEPFFSTKGPEKGTGLGLSTTLGIVKSHGGFIRINSTPGQGSTFAVYLPAHEACNGDTSFVTEPGTDFRGHRETILVVDDEAGVRDILRAVLTRLNFKVFTASSGTAALVRIAERPTQLHAVITDLHMPCMDGLSFVRVLKSRLPQVGIIVVSGRLDETPVDEFKQLGVSALLEKPFTQEKLVEALKTILSK